MTIKKFISVVLPTFLMLSLCSYNLRAKNFSEKTYLITELTSHNLHSNKLWSFLVSNNSSGVKLELETLGRNIVIKNSNTELKEILKKVQNLTDQDQSKIIPVFLNYNGDVSLLDSIIKSSDISKDLFFLPRGETWPSVEYLLQANRRIILFIDGNFENESRILHDIENYVFKIYANRLNSSSLIQGLHSNINLELLMIDHFEELPTVIPMARTDSRNLAPEYINFLLESWKKYGKKPNFIFVGDAIFNFDFIVDQLNSFSMIQGRVRISGKNLEQVYWKNPDILLTGGKFCFPFRGGEEVILTPYAPGYSLSPEQTIVTAEMAIPESFLIIATPLDLSENMTSKFDFDGILMNAINPTQTFEGSNFSFSQDIEKGDVLRLPENASINLGNPVKYGLRNSSFTVCCFVKFTEILEYGDNAIIGNYETGYRKGMHLVLRSGHPYFGLWANDFISEETLKPNVWYHIAWRYIIQTGEQSILVNGRNIGSSDGHSPFIGTSDIQLGSALSSGASLRGYVDNLYIWNRPLGNEEINRLYLDETIEINKNKKTINNLIFSYRKWILTVISVLILFVVYFIRIRRRRKNNSLTSNTISEPKRKNQILLFGELKAINKDGDNINNLFTPKVKELFLFILIYTFKTNIGVSTAEVNEKLWPGIPSKKVANNRSVTLNKLRKILLHFDGIEIISKNGILQLIITPPFFCDYVEAYNLCQIPEGMTRKQLMGFFQLVKRGLFLKGTNLEWLDESRGFVGNQVIDNLLKLATTYKKESKLNDIERVAQRILAYDDLNEEALFLQIWALQKANNIHLAKFNFKSFVTKYQKNMGETFSMNFNQFIAFYSNKF